jgi:hypothetical protein
VTAAAIYAPVSSARQAKDETIGSQLAALREHAVTSRLEVPREWVFSDEGHSRRTCRIQLRHRGREQRFTGKSGQERVTAHRPADLNPRRRT